MAASSRNRGGFYLVGWIAANVILVPHVAAHQSATLTAGRWLEHVDVRVRKADVFGNT